MAEENKQYPKRPRIKYFSYKGSFSYFLTICTDSKKEIFISKEIFELVFNHLKDISNQFGFQIYAYCFMPDHLHLLVFADNEKASLKEFLKMFKQKSGYYYKQKYGHKLWQPSFYDHVLRKEESLNTITEYILLNPVRKGLVENYKDYPYSGLLF